MKKNHALRFLPTLLIALSFATLPASNAMAQSIASVASEEQPGISESIAGIDENIVTLEVFMQKFRRVYNVYFSYEAAALKEVKVVDDDIEKKRPKDQGTLLKKVLTHVCL